MAPSLERKVSGCSSSSSVVIPRMHSTGCIPVSIRPPEGDEVVVFHRVHSKLQKVRFSIVGVPTGSAASLGRPMLLVA